MSKQRRSNKEQRMSVKAIKLLDSARRRPRVVDQLDYLTSTDPLSFNVYDRHQIYREIMIRENGRSKKREKLIKLWQVPEITECTARIKAVSNNRIPVSQEGKYLLEMPDIRSFVSNTLSIEKMKTIIYKYESRGLFNRALNLLLSQINYMGILNIENRLSSRNIEELNSERKHVSLLEDRIKSNKGFSPRDTLSKIEYELGLIETIEAGGGYSPPTSNGQIFLNIQTQDNFFNYQGSGYIELEGGSSWADHRNIISEERRAKFSPTKLLKAVSGLLDIARLWGYSYNPSKDSILLVPEEPLVVGGEGQYWGGSATKSLEGFREEIIREVESRLPSRMIKKLYDEKQDQTTERRYE